MINIKAKLCNPSPHTYISSIFLLTIATKINLEEVFWDRVLFCSPCWLQAHDPPALTSWVDCGFLCLCYLSKRTMLKVIVATWKEISYDGCTHWPSTISWYVDWYAFRNIHCLLKPMQCSTIWYIMHTCTHEPALRDL
jgi:hypothetical protein